MRVAEYNVQANKFFETNILYGDLEKQKMLKIDRERLVTAILNQYPNCNVNNILRKAKFSEIDGTKTKNITSNINKIEVLINEESKRNNKFDRQTETDTRIVY